MDLSNSNSYNYPVLDGRRIADLRKAKNWTQADLANAAGVSQGTVSRMERGEIRAAWSDSLPRIAEALGTTIDYLKGGDAIASPDPPAPDAVPSPNTDVPAESIPESLGGMRAYAEQEKRARKQLARDGIDVPEWVWPHVRAANPLSAGNVPPSVAMLVELATLVANHGDPSAKPPTR